MKHQLTVLQTGLTYDKVIRDVNKRELRSAPPEKNWNNYIDIARGLLAVAEVSRMAVAEVAIRATLIRHGGDRQSVNFKNVQSRLTVKAFANSIGVKPPTLWLWIKIKSEVFDTLSPKERSKFKHDAGEKTLKLIGSKGRVEKADRIKIYSQIATMSPEQRAACNELA